MEDWRRKHEQHRRVHRWNWRVFSSGGKRSGTQSAAPSALELLLAALLATLGTAAWLAWGSALG